MLPVGTTPAIPEAEHEDEHPITGSNDAVGRSTVQPAWTGFWCIAVIHDTLELDDGAVGGRETKKNGDENEETDEFELVSGEFDCKCATPVSLLYFIGEIGEEDIAMQKFGFLLDFDLLFRVSCSQFIMSNNIIFDESAIYISMSEDGQAKAGRVVADHSGSPKMKSCAPRPSRTAHMGSKV